MARCLRLRPLPLRCTREWPAVPVLMPLEAQSRACFLAELRGQLNRQVAPGREVVEAQLPELV
jgi:hypothetical protein